MMVGQVDTGKSTYSRILVSYATRLGHAPIFIDLDIEQ